MSVIKRTSCVLLAIVFVASAFAGFAIAEKESEQKTAKWSVLVYLVADNNLDAYIQTDLDELMAVGTGEDVNVLTIVDGLYTPATLYRVDFGKMVTLEEYGELNMGDPKVLRSFIEYSNEHYPAEHMCLFFWDHGSGVSGVGFDETMEDGSAGGDWLTHQELIGALDGLKVDIMAMDECSIGQIETIYEYAAKGVNTDYIVASESYIGWRGFSYDKILERLTANPDMDSEELSLVIVDEFTKLFSVSPFMSEILTTQTVFKLSEITDAANAMNVLASMLAADIDQYKSAINIAEADSRTPWGSRSAGRIDLPTFLESIQKHVSAKSPVYAGCQLVLDELSDVMKGMGVTPISEKLGYQGVGILFPPSYSMYTVASAASYDLYMKFEFPNNGWWDFLEAYWGVA
ncbi:MAG: hypothetical protein E4H25_01685 [Methanomassiliicoccus sp.]|nr:MAG: hypothetical protein E4H25_01685 [Methanomassiliicoccus sp.]